MATLAEKTKNQSEENSSYEIAAKFSYAVLRNSVPFSITAIIYVIIYIPINLKQFFVAFNGPIQDKPGLQFFLTLWFLCAGNFTTLMNLIFYGVLSKVLRQEVVGRVRNKFSRVSQRIRSVSDDSSSLSTSVSVRHSVNERHFDLDNTFNSTPSDDACMVAFFDEEDERLSSARS
ncbi:uncharacterized protein LOC142357155 [Convolutriloba macropyga]|uniref:uncharacterized protein LOC142357155 n=1 Tax=Convolutriloba macropyga TaxID=536237 RepID=UPI003F5222E5